MSGGFVNDYQCPVGKWDVFVQHYLDWSLEQFPDSTSESCMLHRQSEAKELYDNPTCDTEAADIFFLSLDKCRREGKSFLDVCRKKLDINRNRKWAKKEGEAWTSHVE